MIEGSGAGTAECEWYRIGCLASFGVDMTPQCHPASSSSIAHPSSSSLLHALVRRLVTTLTRWLCREVRGVRCFPSPPRPGRQRLRVHGILPVLMHCGQHHSLSSWANGMGCALHTLRVLCKERVYCPVLAISSASSSVTCMGPLTWVHADVEVASG
jgi:hypothetical protein